jgi:acyl-CoA reductase-like NAD-dependent aldehyde dehydrogenase
VAEPGVGRIGITRRFPIGPVGAITPFNFPLNLVLHKIGPAIAAGNTLVLKPSPRTPLTAQALAALAAGSDLPEGALQVIPGAAEIGQAMAVEPHLKALTFTGSAAVGWDLKAKAAKKRVTLELGGNCGVVVHDDADLDYAAQRVAIGGFTNAGQSCVAVQRVFVQARVYDDFLGLLIPRIEALRLGDPLDETTDLGPMIDLAAAERAESWVHEAVDAGARVLTGGRRVRNLFAPTVLAETAPEMKVDCEEVFAPLITVNLYEEFSDAIRRVNASRFGLQAGVFTRDSRRIFEAFEMVEAGGIMVNDIPTYRVDHMPYGGVKDSGFGREGLRYAIEEMTEPKLLVLNLQR